jgi:hypothetical protein
MTSTLTFNTGRAYATSGQPISAAFDAESGTIAFVDHARFIEGIIRGRSIFSQAVIMAAYDAGAYEMPRPADFPLIDLARSADQASR